MSGTSNPPPVILWFRRDLRLADHPALAAALETGAPVLPLFGLDRETASGWGREEAGHRFETVGPGAVLIL